MVYLRLSVLAKLRCQKQHAELKSLYHGDNVILKSAYCYDVFYNY